MKPLNQFAKEEIQKKSVSVFAGDFLYHFKQNIFAIFFFCHAKVFMNPGFVQSIRKRNNPFWVYSTGTIQKLQQHLQRKAHNIANRYNNSFNTVY